MEAPDSVVPLKAEKNMETVNSFLIRSYNSNTVAVSANTNYLGEGSDENISKPSQGPPAAQVFKMRPGKLILHNAGTRSLEGDLAVTECVDLEFADTNPRACDQEINLSIKRSSE